MLPLPDDWAGAAPHLLPVLRGPTSPANAWEAALDNAEAVLVRRPFAPFLDIVVVLDLPELRLFVNQGHLDRWDAPADAAVDAALRNLPPADGLRPWDEADGVWQIGATDGYASSRLALPGFLKAFEGKVRGAPVAVVPDPHTLLVGGADGGLPTEALLAAGWNTFHEAGTPISCAPYTLREGGVVPWRPGPEHPLVHRVDACHRFLAGHEYRRQHAALEDWLRQHGVADYLTPYSLLRHKSGRVTSLAVWPDGPTLLPAVDLVALGNPGPDLLDTALIVPLAALVQHGLLPSPEPALSPPRFRLGHHGEALSILAPHRVDPRAWSPHD